MELRPQGNPHFPPRPLGRPSTCSREDLEALRQLLEANPGITLKEIAWHMERRMGRALTLMTWSRILRQLGLRKTHGERTAAHMVPPTSLISREDRQIMLLSTLLTDREWEAIQPILAASGARGRPPLHDRRLMWSAVIYMVRSGTPWRAMPDIFPPHKAVFAFYTKVKDSGQLSQVTATLHALWLNHARIKTQHVMTRPA